MQVQVMSIRVGREFLFFFRKYLSPVRKCLGTLNYEKNDRGKIGNILYKYLSKIRSIYPKINVFHKINIFLTLFFNKGQSLALFSILLFFKFNHLW